MQNTTATDPMVEAMGTRNRILTLDAPLAVACPRCGQPAGYECVSSTGNHPLSHHVARRRLTDQMADDTTRLAALHAVYIRMAAGTPQHSTWHLRARTIRQLLDLGQMITPGEAA